VVLVPRAKVPTVGLRRVATGDQIQGVFHYLAAQSDDPELDWKVRHRDNADRLVGGGVLGLAEVVKGLHSLSRLRPLPNKEREQYDNARHLLVHEVAVALGVPPGVAEDYIDYVLVPPSGVKFDVPPPPAPVMLPARPRRHRPAAEEEESDIADLGLSDLGLDLDLDGAPAATGEAAEGGEAAAAGGRDAEAAEGGGAETEGAVASEPPPRPRAAPARAARARPAGKATSAKPARKAPATAPKKAAKAAREKPARKAAAKALPRRGGKKK